MTMKVYCDLHIHSCLSPCGDDEMTPWNLTGMARVKGLDVIALTDHNSALNVPDAIAAGTEYGVQVIPGMEITSREEVHILAYFHTLDGALSAGEEVYAHLPDSSGVLDKLLIAATDLGVDEVCALIRAHNGIPVPAHINRGNNGMIGALGLMPFLPEHPVVEVSPQVPCPEYAVRGRYQLHSSDAHRLEDIQERVFALEAGEATAGAVLRAIEAAFLSKGA